MRDLVRQRNATRQHRWAEEQAALQPLPTQPLDPCREEVASALALLLEATTEPTSAAVRALIQAPQVGDPIGLVAPSPDLRPYDCLIGTHQTDEEAAV